VILVQICFVEIRETGIRRCKGTTTPVVSAVFDKQGELAAAVADTYAIVSFLALHFFFNQTLIRARQVAVDGR
jgi:hypothetical protein